MVEDTNFVEYDNISQVYDVSRAANAETVEKLVKLLHVDHDSVLLDMGCGTGNYTVALSKVAKSVIAIDMSMSMIEQARAKFPELQLICGDVTNLPFGPETFDGVFAIQLLHHVKNKEIFLSETHRVLQKDAYIASHSCSHRQIWAFWFYHYFPKGLEVDLARIPDTAEIALMMEKAGFLNVGIEICYHDVVVANERPESYLEKSYRNGISTFSFLTEKEVEMGCKKLREDIASGNVESIVQQYEAKVASVGGSSIIYGQKG